MSETEVTTFANIIRAVVGEQEEEPALSLLDQILAEANGQMKLDLGEAKGEEYVEVGIPRVTGEGIVLRYIHPDVQALIDELVETNEQLEAIIDELSEGMSDADCIAQLTSSFNMDVTLTTRSRL